MLGGRLSSSNRGDGKTDEVAEEGHDVDGNETAVDAGLYKAIGLYQLLWSGGSRDNAVGRRYRVAWAAVLGASLAMQVVQLGGLYFFANDIQRFAFQSLVMGNSLMCLSKGYAVLRNADRLREGLDLAAFAFTARGCLDPSEMCQCRAKLSVILRAFVAVSYITLGVWMVTPMIVKDPVPYTRLDGTEAALRPTIYNYWFPVSDSAYDSSLGWTVIYAIESMMCIVNVITWLWFDCYAVTMCYALHAQFRTVAAGYEALGHRGGERSDSLGISTKKGDMKSNYDFHNDLLANIQDNQKIMKKFDDFFDVFQPIVLVQITTGSYGVISIIFSLSLAYQMGLPIISIAFFKLFSGCASLIFELYIYCYIFSYTDTAKSMINFGLYSSNWTSMDLKFKKTLLLAMCMNSAHNRVMKISPTSIINLEMFTGVMNMSYSIVSLLLNKSNA